MIKTDYCSKELCLKLEAKGIDAEHIGWFLEDGWHKSYTLDVAAKWLREVHNIEVHVSTLHEYIDEKINFLGWYFNIFYISDNTPLCENGIEYKAYEEALEAGIEYCVDNLI